MVIQRIIKQWFFYKFDTTGTFSTAVGLAICSGTVCLPPCHTPIPLASSVHTPIPFPVASGVGRDFLVNGSAKIDPGGVCWPNLWPRKVPAFVLAPIRKASVDLRLGQRRRRWASIKLTLHQLPVLAGFWHYRFGVHILMLSPSNKPSPNTCIEYRGPKTKLSRPNPANTRRWPNVEVMMARRLRRRPIITSTLGQRLVFAGNWLLALTAVFHCIRGWYDWLLEGI